MAASSPRIPLISAALWTYAGCGLAVAIGNLLGLGRLHGWFIPPVTQMGGLLATSALLFAAGLVPFMLPREEKESSTGSAKKTFRTRLWRFLTSLRLTIFLLGSSTLLILFGTLDQVHDGIYLTQQRYFEHVFAVWSYPPQWLAGQQLGWIQLPQPAGYFVGPLLLVNLFCAHFRYYRHGWRKVGIALIHGGLVILLLGQFVAQVAQEDYFLWLTEGESNNYLESFHDDELVIIDKSDPEFDRVVSWPVAQFQQRQTTLRHPSLPFTVDVVGFLPNAMIMPKDQAPPEAVDAGISEGIGAERNFVLMRAPPTYADGERNRTTAIVDINVPDGSLGRWLVSNVFRQKTPMQMFTPTQSFEYRGRTYEIALRFKRAYLPGSIKLLDFEHDRYPGTEIPYNFSSQVEIMEDATLAKRSTLIYMNHPLRYADYTFYQASFANNDTASMFQVVRNPGRWLPYIACVVMTLGLMIQFTWGLVRFATRRRETGSSRPAKEISA
jgi:hypothetical protein